MFGAAAALQATRAPERTITILDDLSGWGSTGALPFNAPAPAYVPPDLGDTYPPPPPTQWGFTNVRGMRFTGGGSKQIAHNYSTPLNFSGANILVPLRTTDPRSISGTWQTFWKVQFSSDGGASTLAEYQIQASAADFPINKPAYWFGIELSTTNIITSGKYGTVTRLGVPTGKTAPNFAAINYVCITANSAGVNAHGDVAAWDIYFGGLARIERPSEPVISFYFDRLANDNYQYAIPVFERSLPEYGGDGHYRGWKVTFRGDPTDIDVPGGSMTTAQVVDMQHRRGHRFGIYGGYFGPRGADFPDGSNNIGGDPPTAYPVPWSLMSFPSIDSVITGPTADQIPEPTGTSTVPPTQYRGLVGAKRKMVDLGIASSRRMLCGQTRKLYGNPFRTVVQGMFDTCDMPNSADHPVWWPPADPYHAPTRMHLAVTDQANDQANLVTWLDLVKDEKRWGRFLLHNVDANTSVGAGFVMTPTQLEKFCQRIEARGIKVRSHDDVMAGRV